ncbi:MAG: hypothetical protein F4Z59_07730 [Gemmatimonadales bacterium]|nr:hypothetical protein [Gemmatimonadales bacterium]
MGRVLLAAVALAGVAGTGDGLEGQDVPLAADFPEVYRVGGFDAPEWAEFAVPPDVRFDAAGRLYAMERFLGSGSVIVIDADGTLVRVVGRPGEGPGEINRPTGFAVWPDGRLAIADGGHRAYQVFGPDGEFERFVRVGSESDPLGGAGSMGSALRPDPAGLSLIAQGPPPRVGALTALFGELLGAETPSEERVDDRGLERLDLRGEAVSREPILEGWRPSAGEDEPPELSLDDLTDASGIVAMAIGGMRWFEPGFLWDVLPDGGIAYSDSTAYEIKVTDAAGRPTRLLSRDLHPEPVTRRIREAVRERRLRDLSEGREFAAGYRAGGGGEMPEGERNAMTEAIRAQIEGGEFFDVIPVLSALRATWDGALWVERHGEEPWAEFGPIDVMRADGEYVGTFAAGATKMPDAFGPDGLIAFVELDELDIPSIVVRRLPVEAR